MSLKFRVFLHSYLGFNSNSTLIYGEKDAILIDASQLLSDTHRMIAEIIPMRKNLTHIYVSHFHPDHHFGLQVLKHAFPKARIVALPSVVKDIVATSSDKIELWAIDRFGPDDIPRQTTIPMPLNEPRLLLEGEEILVSDNWEGDSINNSVVWIPSIRVACATDVAFHDCHLWPIESNVARRVKWRASIAKLREFDARIVIPGHCDAAKVRLMEEVQEKGFTHLHGVHRLVAQISGQLRRGVQHRQNRLGNGRSHDQALPGRKSRRLCHSLAGQTIVPAFSSPDWLTPLPGKPGKIFLNPSGGYDGDPPANNGN